MIIISVLIVPGILTTISATLIIFCKVEKSQRPLFVTIQMILLNCYWTLYTVYWIIFCLSSTSERIHDTRLENSILTIGDACFLLHDWLLTEKFLYSCLMLPIVLDMVIKAKDPIVAKKNAICLLRVLQMTFYLLLSTYVLVTEILGGFNARMSQFFILFYLSVIFCWSFVKLERLIAKTNLAMAKQTNTKLLALNLSAYMSQCIFKAILFGTGFAINRREDELYSAEVCKLRVAQ